MAADGLIADLAAAGYPVASVTDLRRSGSRYRSAVPVLLKWLPQLSSPADRSEVVRALSVPWARPAAAKPLIDAFRCVDDSVDPTGTGLRWTIGNALEVVGDDSVYGELVQLATDRSYGKARQMIVLGLGKSKRPEAVDVLVGLLPDPDVKGHAVKALGKLKARSARPAVEAMLSDEHSWVRKEAKMALSRMAD